MCQALGRALLYLSEEGGLTAQSRRPHIFLTPYFFVNSHPSVYVHLFISRTHLVQC